MWTPNLWVHQHRQTLLLSVGTGKGSERPTTKTRQGRRAPGGRGGGGPRKNDGTELRASPPGRSPCRAESGHTVDVITLIPQRRLLTRVLCDSKKEKETKGLSPFRTKRTRGPRLRSTRPDQRGTAEEGVVVVGKGGWPSPAAEGRVS